MNSTIDALTERLKGRHLLDEIVGLFRSNGNGNGHGQELKEKVSQGANTAMHTIVDTVKAHPLPVLLMGAGVAWLVYEKRERDRRAAFPDYERDPDDLAYPSALSYTTSAEVGPGESFAYTSLENEDYDGTPDDTMAGMESGEGGGTMDRVREKAHDLKERARQKAGDLRDRVRSKTDELRERARSRRSDLQDRMSTQTGGWRHRAEDKLQQARDRATEMSSNLRYRTRDLAGRTRERVAQTSQEHPLETGLACLALGLLSGLLTPAPRRMEEAIEPAGSRIRERVRQTGSDLVERGKNVVHAASDAAKSEARAQGLTPDAMRENLHEATAPRGGASSSGGNPAPEGAAGPAIADQPDSPEGFRSPSSPPATPPPPTV